MTSTIALPVSLAEPDPDALTFNVENPATGEVVAKVADHGTDSALVMLREVESAGLAWSAFSPRQRSDVLMTAHNLMIERRADLARLISLENGKSHLDALGEVSYAAEYFRWYAEEAVRLRGELFENPTGTNKVLVSHEPIGVCLLVTPWNFPAAMATRKIAPAIAAGCSAILKPAAETPLTALAIADILEEAGLPDGVLRVVTTTSASDVVGALMREPAVRMISFTGSTPVGRVLQRQASESIMRSAMELGGNAPFLVLKDADLDAALDGAMVAKLRNGGQACTAANRFYVHSSVHDRFAEAFAARFDAVSVGDAADESVACGPLINDAAVAKVQELVDDALARGARVITSARVPAGPGSFFPPTVLVDVPSESRILHEEVFGPVAAIVRFEEEEEAVKAANATEFGLVAYLYTRDLARGLRLSARLQAGMIALNRGLVSDPAAPFGGVKQSGIGREGSHEGLLEYVETKYVATDW
ncbi:NAD-dependent succinate-semialdehyde dehydrogenase [Mycetocola miduiensis]|uniref:Succinate-semialdehyde dehydrogenase / glutarate-semialdehyde dehydrogenase n=1 Tax=Mycetocola miduiensis TaxID=995034 RepID=A0A1I5AHB9_9MICO|nr:NAD-dependent succinate-semialdehyde dehydrogenase [Mycetocola miduiensis]SFN61835.1 succinate-semialdehyde dehydrogenase / glutarate-semialdehyde dehydrogenase [Mycetocola miduiensis]